MTVNTRTKNSTPLTVAAMMMGASDLCDSDAPFPERDDG